MYVSTLVHHLDRLEAWLRRDPDAPAWSEVRLVEAGQLRAGRVDEIPRQALSTVAAYEARFEVLFAAGHGWINLSGLGVYDGWLVVVVELPRDVVGAPYGRTSVNLSGPGRDANTGALVWDARRRIAIVD